MSVILSPTFTYNLQQVLPMRHRVLKTIPPNYSGWHNSMMNFYHDAHATTRGGHFRSVFYQVTDFHCLSFGGAPKNQTKP
jgi:hypothetical protein